MSRKLNIYNMSNKEGPSQKENMEWAAKETERRIKKTQEAKERGEEPPEFEPVDIDAAAEDVMDITDEIEDMDWEVRKEEIDKEANEAEAEHQKQVEQMDREMDTKAATLDTLDRSDQKDEAQKREQIRQQEEREVAEAHRKMEAEQEQAMRDIEASDEKRATLKHETGGGETMSDVEMMAREVDVKDVPEPSVEIDADYEEEVRQQEIEEKFFQEGEEISKKNEELRAKLERGELTEEEIAELPEKDETETGVDKLIQDIQPLSAGELPKADLETLGQAKDKLMRDLSGKHGIENPDEYDTKLNESRWARMKHKTKMLMSPDFKRMWNKYKEIDKQYQVKKKSEEYPDVKRTSPQKGDSKSDGQDRFVGNIKL